jgi:hypothetical protein
MTFVHLMKTGRKQECVLNVKFYLQKFENAFNRLLMLREKNPINFAIDRHISSSII